VNMGDWILFDNTGLKGEAAAWAKDHIDGTLPKNLERHPSSSPDFNPLLKGCSKVVYTIGFDRRTPPQTPQFPDLTYNEHNGIIAPGLFGLGIAYPERVEDPFGNKEYNVGLWKFMVYLRKVLPLWMQYAP
ncbi:MAG: pyridine nucleotide-disulfide oxidoreductase, partial [Simkaniaceae bacterium]|nr:pyridine nucleotide-disulfide oxidoreductase [Simkaniaceae bacterium]